MSQYDKDFLSAYGYQKPADFFNPPIELAPYGEAWQIDYASVTEVADVNTKFVDIQIRDLPQIIMCEPDEFDAKWDAFVAALDELYLFLDSPVTIEYIRNNMKRVRKKDSSMVLW